MPAQAGIQKHLTWIPAFAGMTKRKKKTKPITPKPDPKQAEIPPEETKKRVSDMPTPTPLTKGLK
jgi:ppGpp synthetase/RelA/SpoT-type nucleotidyltranferase